ncbi:type VII toxin-antitoxin system HepT family RNase toxin [Stutzerimonas kirkiae]|uniref:DUF86 domain-containing protein n=1 Tax=Stutzerimonas kirkiae TaxID=2211392 RepID=A0A4Q9REJ8_9GAMM|nr:DUF86 domain-containing protein [Stutzerimonas kirkiae]TBV00129.1 hypothetical protein DNJ96_01345 [Stutzerimonas kirkiae]TBV05824.1 hypothetical protein DNJ95_02015 [Stutzerimonas kirkiae]TBV10590.1 hypothetical protein DNK08_06045 [Stutzerimonas kirkiae]TBV17446.1 hypothetical protein DNK01_00870 [Stutzerimonas kirkiae]
MDRLIIERKLDSLQRCLTRVREKTPADLATLENDLDLQDVLVLNLSRAVQICVDIAAHILSERRQPPPDSMGQAFDLLARERLLDTRLSERLKRSVGFRNLAVHNYETINWAIVHSIATRHLADFEDFARQVLPLILEP